MTSFLQHVLTAGGHDQLVLEEALRAVQAWPLVERVERKEVLPQWLEPAALASHRARVLERVYGATVAGRSAPAGQARGTVARERTTALPSPGTSTCCARVTTPLTG